MKTIFDYTAANQRIDAACPQRPSWQISPVGYEWARVVFADRQDKAVKYNEKKINNGAFSLLAKLYKSAFSIIPGQKQQALQAG